MTLETQQQGRFASNTIVSTLKVYLFKDEGWKVLKQEEIFIYKDFHWAIGGGLCRVQHLKNGKGKVFCFLQLLLHTIYFLIILFIEAKMLYTLVCLNFNHVTTKKQPKM